MELRKNTNKKIKPGVIFVLLFLLCSFISIGITENFASALPNTASAANGGRNLDGTGVVKDIKIVLKNTLGQEIKENDVIHVTDAEGLFYDVNFKIAEEVKAGDYLTIKLPNNFNIYGTTSRDQPNVDTYLPRDLLYEGEIIASSQYDYGSNTVTYTFTKSIEKYSEIDVGITQPIFVDSYKVHNNQTLPVSLEVAGTSSEAINQEADFSWGNYYVTLKNSDVPVSNLVSLITEVNYETGQYTQIIVANPLKVHLNYSPFTQSNGVVIEGGPESFSLDTDHKSDTIINFDNTNITIFNYPNPIIDESLFIDTNGLSETEFDYSKNITFLNNHYKIERLDFSNGQTYLIRIKGSFDITNPEEVINIETQTKMTGFLKTHLESRADFFYDNQNIIYPPGAVTIGTKPAPGEVSLLKTVDGREFTGQGVTFDLYRAVQTPDPYSENNGTGENNDILIAGNLSLNDSGKITTNELKSSSGKYIIDGKLIPGLYYFREISAPQNQKLSTEPLVFQIEPESSLNLTFNNESSLIEIPVKKEWTGLPENQKSPVTIEVYGDGQKVDSIILDGKTDENPEEGKSYEASPWEGIFRSLPEYKKSGGQNIEIQYSVQEEGMENGHVTINGNDFKVGITQPQRTGNTYSSAIIKNTAIKDFTAIKRWKDGNPDDYIEPKFILQRFLLGETETSSVENTPVITPSGNSGEFLFSWTDLEKYDENGKEYLYTVKEVGESQNKYKGESGIEYEVKKESGDGTKENPLVIVNQAETISVVVSKQWTNVPSGMEKPPVYFQLMNGDKKIESPKVLKENTVKWNNLPKTFEGQAINYTVKEVDENGNEWKNPNFSSGNITGNMEEGYTAENIYRPVKTEVTITAEKFFDKGVLKDGDFEFELRNKDANPSDPPLQKKSNIGSTIHFDPISFNNTGIFYYNLNEVDKKASDIVYDSITRLVKVEVKEIDGKLVAETEYIPDNKFINRYYPSTTEEPSSEEPSSEEPSSEEPSSEEPSSEEPSSEEPSSEEPSSEEPSSEEPSSEEPTSEEPSSEEPSSTQTTSFPRKLTIYKVDENGKALAGAVFEIWFKENDLENTENTPQRETTSLEENSEIEEAKKEIENLEVRILQKESQLKDFVDATGKDYDFNSSQSTKKETEDKMVGELEELRNQKSEAEEYLDSRIKNLNILGDKTVEKYTDSEFRSLGKFTTKDDGTIIYENLKKGTYKITEISPPNGYLLADETSKEVTVNDIEEVYTLEFINNKSTESSTETSELFTSSSVTTNPSTVPDTEESTSVTTNPSTVPDTEESTSVTTNPSTVPDTEESTSVTTNPSTVPDTEESTSVTTNPSTVSTTEESSSSTTSTNGNVVQTTEENNTTTISKDITTTTENVSTTVAERATTVTTEKGHSGITTVAVPSGNTPITRGNKNVNKQNDLPGTGSPFSPITVIIGLLIGSGGIGILTKKKKN